MRRAFSFALALTAMMAVSLGCTKRIPHEEPESGIWQFDGRQKVVVTFVDGSQITGKIGVIGERVELVTGGDVYRATVVDLTDEVIDLGECRFMRRAGEAEAARMRLTEARLDLGGEAHGFSFQIEEIESVDRVTTDALKTATRAAFWTLTGAVSAFLLSENS